jgi:hypothetical protein
MPIPPLIPSEGPSFKELLEEKEMRQNIEDCATMAISIITRSSYLIQLAEIRSIFLIDNRVKTILDTIIIEEIGEVIDGISLLSQCDIFELVDGEDLNKLLEELGYLDVDKAREYGENAWKMFSKVITDYIVGTWK